jgi:dipeptidyl aminopeptidase/acylaminoacyl peptidase
VRSCFLPTTGAALLVALAVASPAAAAPAPPRFATPESVAVSPELQWAIPLGLLNPGTAGIYLDSLFAVVEDRDAGATHAPRVSRMNLQVLVKLLPSVAAGDSGVVVFVGTPSAERATITFTIHGRHSEGDPFTVSSTTRTEPGPFSTGHPSEFVNAGGRKVETVWVGSPAGHEGPLPVVLLIHDDGSHARHMLANAIALTNRGFHVMLVSMPGYGLSEGAVDFAGPGSVAAVSAALDALKARKDVIPDRIAVWGYGLGATVGTLLAARRGDIAGVIAQGGYYDLAAVARGSSDAGLRQRIAAAVGTDSSAWRARSPAASPGGLQSPLFVLHGMKDTIAPAAQAQAFVAAAKSAGGQVESVVVASSGHEVNGIEANRTTRTYLTQKLKE